MLELHNNRLAAEKSACCAGCNQQIPRDHTHALMAHWSLIPGLGWVCGNCSDFVPRPPSGEKL